MKLNKMTDLYKLRQMYFTPLSVKQSKYSLKNEVPIEIKASVYT